MFAAMLAGLTATALAQQTSSTTTPATTATTPSIPSQNSNLTNLPFQGSGMMMGGQQFGKDFGAGQRGLGFMQGLGGFGDMMGANVELTSAFNETISKIIGNDTDVQKLLSQGYNVSSIRPMLKSVIGADGTVTTKATTAIVTLQNGTSGYATVNVDITNEKVTQIVILTRTTIDKSTTST